ncbi:aminopeptidase P family protein [Campylobacter sp. MG1]|uniref:aminopeptidase P family protein n=1 Tax=Campylobacter sp. MG1 TaxID=2976332 RepID=UPI00226CC271|nr:aminopeptidase P family protein [Campylobacter sp. MG1]
MSIYKERIKKLQELIKFNDLDFYIVLSSDPHASEYLPDFYKTRAKLSGFSGSAGTLIVSQNEAFLFTDGRYFLQASKQLEGSDIKLCKTADYFSFLSDYKNAKIGIDYSVLMHNIYLKLSDNFNLVNIDLASEILENSEIITNEIYKQDDKFISLSASEKILKIKKIMREKNINHHIISSLDDIAYITNLRGSDVLYNPVFLSYLIISDDNCVLFVNEKKLNSNVKIYLQNQGIIVKDYCEILNYSNCLNGNILLDYEKTSTKLALNLQGNLINDINPSVFLKSCKNEIEIENIKQAHIQDGVALVRFFMDFEKRIGSGEKLNECDIDTLITNERAKHNLYISNSFSTIAGFNENAALPHYRAIKGSAKQISKDGILLIDSGAQYQNGTTDITRVIAIGKVSDEVVNDYTLVLKSHIAMSSLIHKEDVLMPLLDVMARSILWEKGLDYMHGTGHGVGYFLNVHEGPQVLSYLTNIHMKMKVKKGMLTSIEPGLYKYNQYGIRLENLVLSMPYLSTEYGEFLKFESVTLYPFELNLINLNMLDEKEKLWLNSYHEKVFKTLSPYLNDNEKYWLENKTKKIN